MFTSNFCTKLSIINKKEKVKVQYIVLDPIREAGYLYFITYCEPERSKDLLTFSYPFNFFYKNESTKICSGHFFEKTEIL